MFRNRLAVGETVLKIGSRGREDKVWSAVQEVCLSMLGEAVTAWNQAQHSWGPGKRQDEESEAAAQKAQRCHGETFPASYHCARPQEDTATPFLLWAGCFPLASQVRASGRCGSSSQPRPWPVPSLATCTLSYGFKETLSNHNASGNVNT